LKRLRLGKGLTATEVAYMVGRSSGTVLRYESGHAAPSAGVLVQLALVLDTPVNDFFVFPSEEVAAAS
jgi:transcriptional regulator with XRE-family HTH domain